MSKTTSHKSLIYFFCFILISIFDFQELNAQETENKSSLCIIDNIASLESVKDPKCHATANRLEDFMYGTPLNDAARVKKTELQKKLLLYVWDATTKKADELGIDTINLEVLKVVANNLNQFGKLNNGTWFVESSDGNIIIESNDLRQYSSVAYALRAMLSVEQDFLFNPSWELKPLSDKAVEALKLYTDLVTLASLKLADKERTGD